MTKRQMYIKLVVSSLIRRKARMIVALLAVAIGATIMSGLVTIYYDIPRQLGKEFRSYGANFVVLPSGNEKISDTEFDKIKNELSPFIKKVTEKEKSENELAVIEKFKNMNFDIQKQEEFSKYFKISL